MYNKLLFIDRDKELELQQTCLTEKDRLLQQLQQVTKQSEGINTLLESILIIQIFVNMTQKL